MRSENPGCLVVLRFQRGKSVVDLAAVARRAKAGEPISSGLRAYLQVIFPFKNWHS